MAKWTQISDVQFDLMCGDRVIGHLSYSETERWEMFLPGLNRTGVFHFDGLNPQAAMQAAAVWVLEVLTEETRWMSETAAYLKGIAEGWPVDGVKRAPGTTTVSGTPTVGPSSS